MSKIALLYGFQFDGNGRGVPVDEEQLRNGIPQSKEPIWLHFDYTSSECADWMYTKSALDSVVCDALLSEESRPRTSQIEQGLLIALRGVNLSPGSDPEDMVGVRIWTDGNVIVSTRKRQLLSVHDIADALIKGAGPKTVGDFLISLSDGLMTRMQTTIDDTEDQVASIEEELIEFGDFRMRSRISALRRTVISLRRYLAPQREAMAQMQNAKVSWLTEDDRQSLREVSDHLIRYIEDLDSVRDRAAVAQEELANRLSEQMNSRMYLLSMITAVFLPLGFLTGLLGINVGGMPGADNPEAFWVVIFLLSTVVAIQIYYFKWKNWI
ncbi:MAG: zinc transporter ZntB [Motiliproteus sp.]|nr:zinc transporter ZntB [Motiliproteus sp.]